MAEDAGTVAAAITEFEQEITETTGGGPLELLTVPDLGPGRWGVVDLSDRDVGSPAGR